MGLAGQIHAMLGLYEQSEPSAEQTACRAPECCNHDSGIETVGKLHRTACTLIRLGHIQVWDYPWDLFLTAIDEAIVSGDTKKVKQAAAEVDDLLEKKERVRRASQGTLFVSGRLRRSR